MLALTRSRDDDRRLCKPPKLVLRGNLLLIAVLSQVIQETRAMSTILLIILILLLVGAFPSWPHSRSWGYGPSGALGVILIVVLVMALSRTAPV